MLGTGRAPKAYRFGAFELDVGTGELRKYGTRIKLQEQPLQMLVLLLEHAGELVTREQIQNRLWPPGTHVDYDNAINSAMRKLREALGDNSGAPRFIETFARRGYRFIGTLDTAAQPHPASAPAQRKSRRGVVAGMCGAILLVAIAAGVGWHLRPGLETKAAPQFPVPLTATSGWESYPSVSPDGNQVAYVWRQEGDSAGHIYVKLIGEGKPMRLTSDAKSDLSPVWSPDGRTIAFLRDSNGTSRIYTVPALGGAERQIAEGLFNSFTQIRVTSPMAWSPDGRSVAAEERQPYTQSSSLVLIGVENGDRFVLTKEMDAKTWDVNPAFSPDGRQLLFTRLTSDYRPGGLYIQDLGTGYRPSGEARLLRQERNPIFGTTWTTDGTEVVYALGEDLGYSAHLIRIRVAGGLPERVTITGEHAFWPTVAPRGNRLVYSEKLDDIDIWQVRAGERPHRFASSTRREDSPEYSPDGRRIVFASSRSGSQQVWACDSDEGNPVQLTRFENGPSGTPRWSPDGRWIAFDHKEGGAWGVYIMAPDGGQVRRLTEEGSDSMIPSWSGDGKWIYYTHNPSGNVEIWKRASQGGPAIQVTHNGGFVPFESPDRNSLYYEKYLAPRLWMLPLGGGKEKRVLESVACRNFVVVKDGIYYMPDLGSDASASVRFHSFAADQDSEVAGLKPLRYVDDGLTVSPDGKTILFSASARMGSNVMVVDGFR